MTHTPNEFSVSGAHTRWTRLRLDSSHCFLVAVKPHSRRCPSHTLHLTGLQHASSFICVMTSAKKIQRHRCRQVLLDRLWVYCFFSSCVVCAYQNASKIVNQGPAVRHTGLIPALFENNRGLVDSGDTNHEYLKQKKKKYDDLKCSSAVAGAAVWHIGESTSVSEKNVFDHFYFFSVCKMKFCLSKVQCLSALSIKE